MLGVGTRQEEYLARTRLNNYLQTTEPSLVLLLDRLWSACGHELAEQGVIKGLKGVSKGLKGLLRG